MAASTALIASSVIKLGGGIAAMREANRQARIAEFEADQNASLEAESVRSQISKNYTEFAKAGVALEGSPLFTIEKNIETGGKNVQNILRQGKARSKSLRAQGRAALFNAIGSAAGSAAQAG